MVDICCICLDELSNIHTLPCNHTLHTHCFNELERSSNKCPLCRKEFKYEDVLNVGLLRGMIRNDLIYSRDLNQSITIDISSYIPLRIYEFDYELNLQLTDQLIEGQN